MDKLQDLFSEVFREDKLIKMIFSSKRRKSQECSRATLRPVIIGGRLMFQAEYAFGEKVTHENFDAEKAAERSMELISKDFREINIFLQGEDIHVLAANADNPKITRKCGTKCQGSLDHDQAKQYILPDGTPCDFLIRLGVMGQDGRVFQRSYSKFRQINRYLEIIEDVFPYLPSGRSVKIIDFGCGKAYLTFAVYYYMAILKHRDVEITGLDLKDDVIAFCNKAACDLGYDHLKFLTGDIADYTSDSADMVITLHACDTATDYALINAVCWNAKVILSVPCCQHELFSQIQNDLHQPMLKHGILKDRLTEYLTDGLRGLKLEANGYDVDMIEFTSLEHTARNIMIKAVRTGTPDSPKAAKAQAEYEALRDFYHVSPTIDQL